jgi:asparaginyl-tRNA synthetase
MACRLWRGLWRDRSEGEIAPGGFFWVNTPIITASDAEGAGGIVAGVDLGPRQPAEDARGQGEFRAGFFGREAFLTVSGQLNVEAYCLALT